MGKIIAIANQKGGVGKTTTAVNLSAAMGERGHKTLLVDIDPQGNASSGVGIDRRSVDKSTYELLIGEAGAKEALVRTQFPNLAVLPSSLNLAGAELELVDFQHRESRLKPPWRLSGRNTSICLLTAPRRWGLSPPTPSAPPIPCWFPFSANITPWRA